MRALNNVVIMALLALSTALAASAYAADEPKAGAGAQAEPGAKANEERDNNISIESAAIGTAIVDREVSGAATSFPPDVGKLWCYTKIKNGNGTTITHKWFYEDELLAAVPLEIRSDLYRTRSSKRILPGWSGPWRVEVAAEDGTTIKTLEFTIE